MAAIDTECSGIWINRAPTCLSLQQLDCSCPPNTCRTALSSKPQPDAAVADICGACIAQYTYPALDSKPHLQQKRVRSFGDLKCLLVPDIDAELDGTSNNDMSYSGPGTSSDEGDMIVPHKVHYSTASRSGGDGLAILSTSAAAAGNPAAPLHMGMLDTILRTEWDDRNAKGLFRCSSSCAVLPATYPACFLSCVISARCSHGLRRLFPIAIAL